MDPLKFGAGAGLQEMLQIPSHNSVEIMRHVERIV